MSLVTNFYRATPVTHQIALWSSIGLAFFIPISPALSNLFLLLSILAAFANPEALRRMRLTYTHPIGYMFIILYAVIFIWSIVSHFSWAYAKLPLGKYSEWLFIPALAAIYRNNHERALPILAFMLSMLITLVLSYAFWLGALDWLQSILPHINLTSRLDNPYVFKLHITHNVFMSLASLMALSIGWKHYRKQGFTGVFAHPLIQSIPGWAWWSSGILGLLNCLFMVNGRISFIIVPVLLIYVAYLFFQRFAKYRILILALLILSLVAIGLGLKHIGHMEQRIAQGIEEVMDWQPHTADDTSMGIRMTLWHQALTLIKEKPITGYGSGSYFPLFERDVSPDILVPTGNPHQQYLLFWVEQGLPGLVIFLWAQIIFYRRVNPAYNETAYWMRAFVLAIGAGNFMNSFLFDAAEGLLYAQAIAILALSPETLIKTSRD